MWRDPWRGLPGEQFPCVNSPSDNRVGPGSGLGSQWQVPWKRIQAEGVSWGHSRVVLGT